MTEKHRRRPWLAAILVATLLIRVAAIAATGPTTLRFGDAQDYVDAAATLCEEGRYPERGSLPFFRAPGLPLFLAAATLCQPRNVVAAKLALATCDVATAALAAALTLLLLGGAARRAALLAAALVAIDPFLVLASSDVTSEPLATLLLTAALCALLAARRAARGMDTGAGAIALACAGGAAFGLACLTRPGTLAAGPAWLLLPVAGIARGASGVRPRVARRRAIAVVLVELLALTATLAPWTWHNWQRFGELVLVNDAGGYNAWRGTHPRLHAMLAETSPARFATDSAALERELARLALAQGLGLERSPRARDRHWWAAARANLTADPPRGLRILARNVVAFFRPWLDPAAHGPLAVAVSATWFVPLGLLALHGATRAWRRDRATLLLLGAGALLAALAHAPFQTVLRFRLPFTEPLLLVLAASGLARACSRLLSRETSSGR